MASAWLGLCHGYKVSVSDGPCGVVETPLLPPHGGEPDYLIVRASDSTHARLVVPVGHVVEVDAATEVVRLGLTRREFDQLPQYLPLAVEAGPPGSSAPRAGSATTVRR